MSDDRRNHKDDISLQECKKLCENDNGCNGIDYSVTVEKKRICYGCSTWWHDMIENVTDVGLISAAFYRLLYRKEGTLYTRHIYIHD